MGQERLIRRGRAIACAAAPLIALTTAAAPAAESGLDVFGTQSHLEQHTPGLKDPIGYDCALPVRGLTLNVAVDLALCRNPATRAAWASAHQQAAALGIADSLWLPQVGVTGQALRDFGPHVDVTGQSLSGDQNTGDAAVNLTWTLYDFGARSSKIRGARRLLDAAALNIDSVAQQTVLKVVQAYYGVVGAQALQAAARTTESVAEHSLEVARALRGGGAGTLADVLQAETAYDQAVIARVQADAAEAQARGTLAVTLGVSADHPFALDSDPVPAQVPALTARMSDLMAEAVRQRPDLAAAEAQRDAAAANVEVARATGRPVISVNAGHSFIATQGIPDQNYSVIGLNVTVPLFTGFSVTYGVRQAQGALEAATISADQVRLAVSQDVWNAYYALRSANEQLATSGSLSRAADENQQAAIGRYQAGVGTIIDVLTAQNGAATARQVRINAEYGWRVARAQLALSLGRLTSAEPLSNPATFP